MIVKRYEAADQRIWDQFVANSKNGTFLFFRNYMDYHADRFNDYSLLIYDEKEKLIALLPANKQENVLSSHGGLTYGGIVSSGEMTTEIMSAIFDKVMIYLCECGFSKITYKTIPHIYHTIPAEEDIYILFRKNAFVCRRDVLTVIDYRHPIFIQERRKRSIKKAQGKGLSVRETFDYQQFWDILTYNLKTRYNLNPVHTVDEILMLAKRFPEGVKLYAAYDGSDVMQAGTVAYLSNNVCHIQYNASSETGKDIGALDIIMGYLVDGFKDTKRYIDFGVSTEENGHYLNTGLVGYKEGFGGRTIVHDHYEIDLNR